MGIRADSAGAVAYYDPVRLLTREAIARAKRIICMEQNHRYAVMDLAPHRVSDIEVWNVPDVYDYCAPELIELVKEALQNAKKSPAQSGALPFP
jgi:predicted protein tyrosine phosphatase